MKKQGFKIFSEWPGIGLMIMATLCMGAGSSFAAALVADHHAANNFNDISKSYFSQIRSDFHIYYGHTSHGSQIVTGMKMLEYENSAYAMPSVYEDELDLGYPEWESNTRSYLNNHSETNLVVWSWCGQLSDYAPEEVNDYLSKMNQLETDYPKVTFVYMTGHLDGTGASGTLYVNNNRIRSFCKTNSKRLFDFADIESYDPNGNYYPDGTDGCEWCEAWCNAHGCPSCDDCAHSHCFNCYQKGKAFWWLLAKIAGWEPGDTPPSVPESRDYYVRQNIGNDANSGDSWEAGHALATIQRAVTLANAAAGEDTIHVAAGIYKENIISYGHIALYGGYPANGGTARNPVINRTIIDGNGSERVMTLSDVNNLTLDGFVIRNGAADGIGGGIYIENSSGVTINQNTISENRATDDWGGGIGVISSHVTITNNKILKNHTNISGGGMSFYCEDAAQCSGIVSGNTITENSAYEGAGLIVNFPNLTLVGNRIEKNVADYNGGGIFIEDSDSSAIRNNLISENAALSDGGGIFYLRSAADIAHNRIQSNTCGNWGGGICIYGSSGDILNNLIDKNSASVGGGVSYFDSASARLINNTLINNSAMDSLSGGIGCYNNSVATVINTILWGNTPAQTDTGDESVINATYCDIQGGYSGEGNIHADPSFIGNYHLAEDSPCKDTGTSAQSPDTDIDGDARPQGNGYDIGADEFVKDKATQWVNISGLVRNEAGESLCTMVLANGQYMFTCDENNGKYALKVPLDENGEITLFCFCDGFAPFKETLMPEQAADFDMLMMPAPLESPEMNVTYHMSPSAVNPGWVTVSGAVLNAENTPLCTMVLANGQHMFTCGEDQGKYELEVPLDANGEITLFSFCDGFQPFKEIEKFFSGVRK